MKRHANPKPDEAGLQHLREVAREAFPDLALRFCSHGDLGLGDGVSIRCTDCVLDLSYARASYELEGRVAIDFPAISTARQQYWDDWERENDAARRR